MFMNLLPPFVTVLIILSFVLALLPGELLEKLLGADSSITGFFIAAGLGSVALIPGFISYPLAAVLLKNGVSYPVISVFITTLMMVGIVTLPIEKNFFGWRVAIIRNVLSFIGALIIGACMALIWGYYENYLMTYKRFYNYSCFRILLQHIIFTLQLWQYCFI